MIFQFPSYTLAYEALHSTKNKLFSVWNIIYLIVAEMIIRSPLIIASQINFMTQNPCQSLFVENKDDCLSV